MNINIIIIICLILIIFFLQNKLGILKTFIESFENIPIDIGNHLADYFYNLGTAILQQMDFSYTVPDTDLFRHLPSNIKFSDIDPTIYEKLTANGIKYEEFIKKYDCKVCSWFIVNNQLHYFWTCMHPLIHSILDNALIKSNLKKVVEYPVIHFRCADTPFVRNSQYHFQKYKFYKRTLEKINNVLGQSYSKVIILSCSFHRSDEKIKISCGTYTNSLTEYLKSISYEPIVECKSNVEDFATIFYAPAVISIGSSFSFLSGFFGKGIFFSGGHREENDAEGGCNDCNSWVDYSDEIKHNTVNDYHDTDAVIKMLQE
jgi:hypothetical protein